MEFRPCIDIHNGKVKQIVGGSLKDEGNQAKENFVAEQDAAYFAEFYKKDKIRGGHIILLNPSVLIIKKRNVRHCLHCTHIRAVCRLAAAFMQRMPKNLSRQEPVM